MSLFAVNDIFSNFSDYIIKIKIYCLKFILLIICYKLYNNMDFKTFSAMSAHCNIKIMQPTNDNSMNVASGSEPSIISFNLFKTSSVNFNFLMFLCIV